jgi:aminopeptidase N
MIANTQFEPIDARLAFPCFDEPDLKAQFSLTIGRKDTMTTASNMPLKSTVPIEFMPGYVWDQVSIYRFNLI